MASTSETGHAVNIANYKLMADRCDAFGSPYAPSNADITVAKMNDQWTAANTAHTTYITAMATSKDPVNQRELLFAPLDKLVTQCYNYLKSTNADALMKHDVKTLAHRIRGIQPRKATAPAPAPGPTPEPTPIPPAPVSVSHQSFVMKADAFKQFIELLKTCADYKPSETNLQTDTLDILYGNMKTANDNIGTIIAPVSTARWTRNDLLYNLTTGIVARQLSCKDYVRASSAPPPHKPNP